MEQPLSLPQLRAQPVLWGEFGTLGFARESVIQRVASVGDEVEIALRLPPRMRLGAFLAQIGGREEIFFSQVAQKQDGDIVRLKVMFPAAGRYGLPLNAFRAGDNESSVFLGELYYVSTGGSEKRVADVMPDARAVRMGISLDGQHGYNPKVGAETQVSLRISAPVLVSLADSTPKDVKGRVFVVADGDEKRVMVSFPAPGSYTVRIASLDPTSGMWEGIAGLHFVAGGTGRVFPTVYLDAAKLGFQIVAPLEGQLKAGQDVAFDVKGPATAVVYVQVGNTSVQLRGEAGRFRGTVRAAAGSIYVLGGLKQGGSLSGLAQYQAD